MYLKTSTGDFEALHGLGLVGEAVRSGNTGQPNEKC